MKEKRMSSTLKRRALAAVTALLLATPALVFQAPPAKAAGTPAGTVIGNQATATYKDAGNNTFTSTSNLVTTTVLAQYRFAVTPNSTDQTGATDATAQGNPGQSQNSTPGNIVYVPYTLTNNSNTTDSFNVNVLNGSTSTFNPTDVKVFIDANTNGFIDPGDTKIVDGTGALAANAATATSSTIANVLADGIVKLIVQYTVPAGAANATFASIDLRGTSTNGGIAPIDNDTADTNNLTDQRNFARVTVVNDGVMVVTKGVDKATANPGDDLEYTLTISNTGNADVKNIRITDMIPKNNSAVPDKRITDFLAQAVYSVPPDMELQTSTDGTTFAAASTTPGVDAAVTHIRVVMKPNALTTPLPAANTRTVKFKVRVRSTFAEANAGVIPNNATVVYDNTGSTGVTFTTNTAITNINMKSAAQISFHGTPFTPQTSSGADVGSTDATTQASAAAGSFVYYKNVITNRGNAPDRFNLTTSTSTFPAGSTVSFFQLTDGTNPANNTNPVLDTNPVPDTLPDTGLLNPGDTKTIVTRVFIPANASGGPFTATVNATSTNGGTAVAAAAPDLLFDTTRNVVTAVVSPSTGLENIIDGFAPHLGDDNVLLGAGLNADNPNRPVVFTESDNGTKVAFPLSITNDGAATDTFNLTGTVSSITGATLEFFNLIPATTTTTVTANAAIDATSITVASATGIVTGDQISVNGQLLKVTAVAGNVLTVAGGGPTGGLKVAVVSGTSVMVNMELAVAAAEGATSVTLNNASGFTTGDFIAINGQILTVGSVAGNVVTFAVGQTLLDPPPTTLNLPIGTSVSKVGTLPVTSTGPVAAGWNANVVAVVNVPAGIVPATYNTPFTATSTNDPSKLQTVPDQITVPTFRNFSLTTNRDGSGAAGTVLFYDHTITNLGNATTTYDLSLVNDGTAPDFVYQILDNAGSPIPGNVTPNVAANASYTFKVKVTIPAGTPATTVDNVTVKALRTGGTAPADERTNLDKTTVVSGFIQLTKYVINRGADVRTGLALSNGNGIVDAAEDTVPATLEGNTVGSGATARPGDILEYAIDFVNVGASDAVQVKITDLIPANTTYVAGSLRFCPNGTATGATAFANVETITAPDVAQAAATTTFTRTDAVDTQSGTPNATVTADADFAAGTVTFFVGTGSNGTTGGTVTPSGKGGILFRVRVN